MKEINGLKRKRLLIIFGILVLVSVFFTYFVFAGSFNPQNEGQIGYEFLDLEGNIVNSSEGEVVHIWNTKDDYFFDKDSGIQFTNHYKEYWTKNIFCIGFYNASGWNKINCADELTNFNRNIDSDNETYVNATLWKDINYGGYDFRLGVQYHLGLDDKTLSITIYGKNIGIDIPFDLGFAWKITDWEIPHRGTTGGDSIRINDTDYELNGTYNLLFKNMTRTYINWTANETTGEPINNGLIIMPIPTLKGFDHSHYLRINWNENLNYAVKLNSDGNQSNAYVALLINTGNFSSGQEKSTTFQWIDAATSIILYATTGASHQGNFGHRSGVDSFCSDNKPAAVTCDGNIHALVSVTPTDEIRDMPTVYSYDDSIPIKWADSSTGSLTTLATDWGDMLDESILVSKADGTGDDASYWTGSYWWGGGADRCDSWLDARNIYTGLVGYADRTDGGWLNVLNHQCDYAHELICACELEEDTCTCPGAGNDWEIDMSDYCNITTACDLTTGTLNFTGSGYTNCNASVDTTNLGDPGSSGILYIQDSCVITVN